MTTKLLLLIPLAAAGAALLSAVRPAAAPRPMAWLQDEESRRFAELCKRPR